MTILNQSEWIKRLRSIVKSSDSSQWELGDALSQGETAFGRRPCYDLAQTATGWHRLSLYRIAGVASYFPKPLRFENLSWSVYVLLRPFPLSFLEQFIPTIADSGLSGKLIRERACAEYGSDPQEWRKQKKYRAVRIATSLCDKIVAKSGTTKVTALVTEILESWLIGSPVERQPTSGNKTREWNQKVKDAGNEPVEAEKAPVGDTESDGNEPAATQLNPSPTETPRPDYETRRKQQIASGAQPIPAKERKYLCKVKIVFTKCRSNSFIESKDGQMDRFSRAARADRFYNEFVAEDAAHEYSKDHGYTVFPGRCSNCSTASKPVWHVFRENPVLQR